MRNGTEMRHAAGVATTAQTAVPPISVEAGAPGGATPRDGSGARQGQVVPPPQWVGAPSEGDEWLDDSVQLPVHGVECLLEVAERERVGGHACRIHTSGLDDPQQALQAQASAGAEAGLDRLLGHADAPLDTRNVHVLTLAVVANIR